MSKFYYQIKAKKIEFDKDEYGYFDSPWSWPPVWQDVIEANNKKEARLAIEEEYDKKFPQRVLRKNIDKEEFLINITEVKEDDYFTNRILKENACKNCGAKFTLLQKYQFGKLIKGGETYCSDRCVDESREVIDVDFEKRELSYIYKITNKNTGMCYIGQTLRAFTLRWWEHFTRPGDCKFHKAIKESEISDWAFEVLEVVSGNDCINEREQHHIDKNNSIKNGYNSAPAKKDKVA